MRSGLLLSTTAAMALLLAGAAGAQQQGQQAAATQDRPAATQTQQQTPQRGAETRPDEPRMAEACLRDLRAFNEEAVRAGYGMVGPEGYGVTPARDLGAARDAAPPPAATSPGVATPAAGAYGAEVRQPRRDMRILHEAAYIFARNGDEEACRMILTEMRGMFDERMARIREAGVAPEEVRTWRHEQLLEAQPVTEAPRVIRVDRVIGSDVRNMKDEDLGDIRDVLLDPESGQISHVLISRGGFLGIGRDYIAVRWQDLKTAPGVDAFVLDVPESVVENAPKLDRDAFRDIGEYGERRQTVDRYWDENLRG